METSNEIKEGIKEFLDGNYINQLAIYFLQHLPSNEETLSETSSYLYKFSEAIRECGKHYGITPDYPFEFYAEYMIFANDTAEKKISYKKLCAYMKYTNFDLDKWHNRKHCQYVNQTMEKLFNNHNHGNKIK